MENNIRRSQGIGFGSALEPRPIRSIRAYVVSYPDHTVNHYGVEFAMRYQPTRRKDAHPHDQEPYLIEVGTPCFRPLKAEDDVYERANIARRRRRSPSAEGSMAGLQVRRLGYSLGAEVTGIDLVSPDDTATMATIKRALLEHLVVCIRRQRLSRDAFIAFASSFGEVHDNPEVKHRDPENKFIMMLTNKPFAGKPASNYKNGQDWHTDRAFLVDPTPETFLLAKELPEVGGDTMFANQYEAYQTLSPVMQALADSLIGVHQQRAYESRIREKKAPPVMHPLVKGHPETGRKALYLGKHLRQFVGMTEEESRPLLDFFGAHATRYELTYRHRWQLDDLLLWDNRCLLHIAVTDYDLKTQPRDLWKAALRGPDVGRVFEPDSEGRHVATIHA